MNEEIVLSTSSAELDQKHEPIIELSENAIVGFEVLCRLCANQNDHLIPIYGEEGVSNELAKKMNLYLPLKVSENDSLPLQCCYQCASTVLTWHELVVASIEADRRLQELQTEMDKQILQESCFPEPSEPEKDDGESRPAPTRAASLSQICQEMQKAEDPKPVQMHKQSRTSKQNQRNSDAVWIKSELVIEEKANIINQFQDNCQIPEEQNLKVDLMIDSNSSESSTFHNMDESMDSSIMTSALCAAKYSKQSDFDKHIETCTEDVKTEDEDRDDEFLMSLDVKDKKNKREYQCQFCTIAVVGKESLKAHVENHHPNKYATFLEKRRRKRSKIDQDAVERAKIVVESRTYYHCDICGKNLHSPYTYIWHNRIHTGERPFVCDLCGKQFRVSQGLVRHLRETHAGIKNFACDLCGRMFATRRNVEEHRRIHTNERPYVCDLCGKAFKQKASLFVHNRSHNDTFPFRCSYCNQGFRTKPPLLVHVTRHTGEKPFACDICGRCFRIKYELKRHRLIHSDDKPFSCTDCGLSFRQKRYLRNHNKINHNRSTP